jgi:3-dehydroquinate synthetase
MSSILRKTCSARNIDRQSFAVAIGGGAVLDAVGFAAAIFHRGVRHPLPDHRAGAGRLPASA